MKRKIVSTLVLTVVALVAFCNIKYTRNSVTVMSNLALANIEALTSSIEEGEEGEATITCSRTCGDGIGKCWRVIDEYGNCQSSGDPNEYCVCHPL